MSHASSFRALRARLPECVAVGVVELSSGTLVAWDGDDGEAIELVAATAPDLLRGGHTPASLEARAGLREALVVSRRRIDVCVRIQDHREHALVLLCRASANIGAVLAHARLEAAQLAKKVA